MIKWWKQITSATVFLGIVVGGVWAADGKYDQSGDVKEIKKEVNLVEQKAGDALASMIIMIQSQRVDDLSEDLIDLKAKDEKSESDIKRMFRKQRSIDSAQRMIDKLEKK